MTTFTMQELNNIEVTKEEEEAMDALCRLATGRPMLEINPTTQDILNNLAIPQPTEPSPEAIIEEMVSQFSLKLKLLLTTVINQTKAQPTQGNSHGGEAVGTDVPSLQECVDTTLQQAEWLKEMVDRKVDELLDDKDFAYEINSEVEDWFNNSFSLDDHVDIAAEVESKLEDIVERMVEDKLQEVVEEKLRVAIS